MPVCRIYDSAGRELTQCTTEVFQPNAKIVFGRSSHCDVSLKKFAESSISREHFYIQQNVTGQWVIYDNDSHAGILQDAKKITSAPLYDGTIIRFGRLFFTFGEKGGPSHFRLKWTDENGISCWGYLWEGVNTIGASRDNYVTVRQGNVARFHANIIVRGSSLILEPVNTFVKTELNGELLEGAKTANGGDVFTMNEFPVEIERVDFAQRRVAVVMSSEEVSRKNAISEQTKSTSKLMAFALLAVGIMVLVGLVLMVVQKLPSIMQ